MWKPSMTPNDVLMHSAKGTHWKKKDHKYIDIIDGRYIYQPAANAAATIWNSIFGQKKDTPKNVPKKVSPKAGTSAVNPKSKSTTKTASSSSNTNTSNKHGRGITYKGNGAYKKGTHKGNSSEFRNYSAERNAEGRSTAKNQINAANKKKQDYEAKRQARLRAERNAEGRESARKQIETANRKKRAKANKVKNARHKGTVQVRNLKKPGFKDYLRNAFHEGDIRYKRAVRNLKKKFKW